MTNKKQPLRTAATQVGFIGRADAKQRFFELLSEPPQPLPLLLYYGTDGNGKTSLLKELQQYCALPDVSVPFVALNFDGAPTAGGRIASVHAAVIRLAEEAKKSRLKGIRAKKMQKILADAKKLSHYRTSVDAQEGIVLAYGGGQFVDAVMKGAVEGIVVSGLGFIIYNHKAIAKTLGNILADLRGNLHSDELQTLSPEEFEETLDRDYAAHFADAFDDKPGRFVKAVLFFDTYELADADKHHDWLRGLHRALGERGILCVVADQQELTGWQNDAVSVPVYGFTREEAAAYLEQVGAIQQERFGVKSQMPTAIQQEILIECLHRQEQEQNYYSPALLEGYADILRIGLEQGSGYPDSLHLGTTETGKTHVGRLLDRTFRVIPEAHGGVKPWLCELALAPAFDEQFADAINFHRKSRHSNAPSVDWAYLSQLSLLNRQEVAQGRKKFIFYSLPRAYKHELIKNVTPDHVQDTHRVGVEHWLERAEGELSKSEYDLYTMEQPYWQRIMSNCLFHLHELKEPVTPKTLLLITKLLLDFYWWWCENLPHETWHDMVDRAAALTREEHGEVGEVLALLKRFDAAWPKRWQLNPQNWKPEGERTEEERGWDYSEVLSSLQALKQILQKGVADLRADARVAELYEYADMMIAYYEGHAHHYQALTRPGSESTFRQAAEALNKHGDFAGFKPERHRTLKRAWSRIALAELCLDTEDYSSATAYALEVLQMLPPPEKQEGVDMEGAGNAYHALSRIARKQKHWEIAGKRMGVALLFNVGFYATDQDNYAYEYYRYQQQSGKEALCAAYEHSPGSALEYLRGLKRVWGSDSTVPTGDIPLDALLVRFDETFPPKLVEKPSQIEKKDFIEAKSQFAARLASIQAELAFSA